ncbi:MAG: hypothetical protein IAF38_01715 [Bacteroidia bacterium]|nr:hypothetical protein [Bacteroidia bacterium]
MAKKFKDGYEEVSFLRQELKKLMGADPAMHTIKNHLLSMGIDQVKIDIVVNQVFKDQAERKKYLAEGKKFYMISLLFFVLFGIGVAAWFYIWGDWITYFAGANLIAFLFLIQRGNSLKSKAAIYE